MSGRNSELSFELTKRIEGITRSMNRVTYEAVVSMVLRLDEVSPVGDVTLWNPENAKRAIRRGYRGGQFRANWQLGVNERPMGWLPGKIDPSGAETVSVNIAKIPQMASRGYSFYVVNNTPYGRALEDGHSTQMPHNMIYRVKREFNGMVRKIVAEIKQEGGRVR
jgi:hypothetical protein